MIKYSFIGFIFLIGLIYLILPFPTSINNFPALPYSVQSDESGDTWQNPNISAYFSQFTREEVTSFYHSQLRNQFILGAIFPPLTLNRPPEEAYQYIRDQQFSTYLEEYVYLFKGSLFVNGYEPIVANNGPVSFGADHIEFKNNFYLSKTTLRFYPTPLYYSIPIYIGIWLAIFGLFKIGRKVWEK